MKETPQKNRTIMSIVAIAIGLLMIALIPFLIQTSLSRVLENITRVVAEGKQNSEAESSFLMYSTRRGGRLFLSPGQP